MITLTIELSQEPDMTGQWVSRCVELDIVSAAMKPESALEAVAEAVRMSVRAEMARLGLTEVEAFGAIAAQVAARHPMTGAL